MGRGHMPYGYYVENSIIKVDGKKADQVRLLCRLYLAGKSLSAALKEADLSGSHTSAMKMMLNKRYLGDSLYPAILDRNIQDKVVAERNRRESARKRVSTKRCVKEIAPPSTAFLIEDGDGKTFSDPLELAQYTYSLIKEV